MFTLWISRLALLSLALTSVAFRHPSSPPLPNMDARPRATGVDTVERKAIMALREMAPEVMIELDPSTRSVTHVKAQNGFLAQADEAGRAVGEEALRATSKNDPHRATKAFLRQHRQLFRHGPEALDSAAIKRNFLNKKNRFRTVVWEQRVEEVPVFDGLFISHTTAQGDLVSVSSQFAFDTARAPQALAAKRPAKLKATHAVQRAAANLGLNLTSAEITVLQQETKGEQKHRLGGNALTGDTTAELTWLSFGKDELRLCWNVVLKVRSRGEYYRVLVDANTGDVLLRRCLTAYLTNSTFRVFTSDSPTPFSPGWPSPNTGQPGSADRSLISLAAINTNASPNSWIDASVNETRGNNVDAHLDRDDNDLADLPRPQGSPHHVFDFPLDFAQSPTLNGNASVVQLFYWCNFMHDKLYELGFTEAAGNFQANNFGRGGLGNDALQADAQDGGGFNNANMSTLSDGLAPRMQMYLFNGPNPDRDGTFDSEIVLHEYTHGLSTRLVGGGMGIFEAQTEGMGEGWSDFYALALLSEPGDNIDAPSAMAGYATYQFGGLSQNYYFGIRRYPYSTDLTKNPLTFRDISPAQAAAHAGVPISPVFGGGAADEVHNMGEVWCVALWDMRANLIRKHGWTNGNQLALQLVTDGMILSPANPNFLQGRDAIILADELNNGGANRVELWTAFAKRGMGASARSPDSSTTAGLQEGFDLPDDLNVFPHEGLTSSGPVGGPFLPADLDFSLRNTGTNSLTWTAVNPANWLDLSLSEGVLATGATASVRFSVNTQANQLPVGVYTSVVHFTNQSSGIAQSRVFTLRVGQPDYFTELFRDNLNLSHSVFTFTPDGSSSFYSVCREVATNFPTDPTGGTTLTMTDDSLQRIFLADGRKVSLYGTSSGSLELVSNGFLTFTGNDVDFSESVSDHFQLPRIAALFRDLYPPGGGTISWLQLSNRFVATYENVPEYVAENSNSFQIEWFFDGRIRITYLQIDARSGLAGLSRGAGLPAAFKQSDFDSYGSCSQPLMLASMAAVSEGAGTITNGGRVDLSHALATNFTVTLASTDTTEVTVPPSVVIVAGETNAFFDLMVLDDSDLDGTQTATITAEAPGFISELRAFTVNDNESATLGIELPSLLVEGSGVQTQGLVTISAPAAADVSISLHSSDALKLEVPAHVSMVAGQTSVLFAVTLPENALIDGSQTVAVTATVTNWNAATKLVTVMDNEMTNLTVSFAAPQLSESDGTLAGFGSVQIPGAVPLDLVVSLSSSSGELAVTAEIVIPAGQTAAPFSVTPVDDDVINVARLITITASATGFMPGTNTLALLDDESPAPPSTPFPAHLAASVIANSALAWNAGPDTTNEVYFGVNPAPGAAQLVGTTEGTNWTLPLLAPATTYYWRIISHRIGIAMSPVWSFTTRGLHHFVASSIAGTQYVGIPFPLTITAKDEFDSTVSNFTGVVQFSARDGSGEIFHADFDSGLNGFALDNDFGRSNGLWHLTTARGTEPGHSGPTSLYYGRNEGPDGNGDYDTARGSEGVATSPLINLSHVAPPITLTFQHLIQTELATNWDHATVEISTNEGATFSVLAARSLAFTNDSNGLWLREAIDLTSFTNASARLRFHFDSVDGAGNNFEGWFIDDITVTGSSVSIPMTPATSTTFTNGVWSGSVAVSIAANNVFIAVEDGTGHKAATSSFVATGAPRVTLTIVGENVVLTWPSVPGGRYRLESKTHFEEPWTSDGPEVLTPGVMGAVTNSAGSSGRFYQLRLLP